MADYVRLVLDNADPAEVAEWLWLHAKKLKEWMWFGENTHDLIMLSPYHLATLRACSPEGFFTETGKSGYLARVAGNNGLVTCADDIFKRNDFDFLISLPVEWRPAFKQLLNMAYHKRIRPSDARVKA